MPFCTLLLINKQTNSTSIFTNITFIRQQYGRCIKHLRVVSKLHSPTISKLHSQFPSAHQQGPAQVDARLYGNVVGGLQEGALQDQSEEEQDGQD